MAAEKGIGLAGPGGPPLYDAYADFHLLAGDLSALPAIAAVLSAPKLVPIGKSFELDGSKSMDVGGGTVVVYEWSYLGPA